MRITLANISTSISDDDFAAAVSAVSTQISRDLQPEWNVSAELIGTRLSLEGDPRTIDVPADAIIYVGDRAQDPTSGADRLYGYHDCNYHHLPFGFVYRDVASDHGLDWSCFLSHETCELLTDPTAIEMISGTAPDGTNVNYCKEICDPTQLDFYPIGTVKVSNFVTRAYFGMAGGSGVTNYLNLALDPFDYRPGGYVQFHPAGGGSAVTLQGARITDTMRAAKARLGPYRRNARRAKRLPPPNSNEKETS